MTPYRTPSPPEKRVRRARKMEWWTKVYLGWGVLYFVMFVYFGISRKHAAAWVACLGVAVTIFVSACNHGRDGI
jgi:hypothetical protein